MYGYLASGRLVCTQLKVIDDTRCAMEIPNCHQINHLAVFLTGAVAHREGVATAIYICFPSQNGGEQDYFYIGHISNQKPSAIFKLTEVKNMSNCQSLVPVNFANSAANFNHNILNSAILYLVHESFADIESKVSAINNSGEPERKTQGVLNHIQRVLENYFNYANSFSVSTSQILNRVNMGIVEEQAWIPFDTYMGWYKKILNRLGKDPNFLRDK